MTTWTGRITVHMSEKEDAFSTALRFTNGSAAAMRYGPDDISLKFASEDERANVMIRFTTRDCRELVSELVKAL